MTRAEVTLQRILQGNGAFCFVGGLILLIFNTSLQAFLSVENVDALFVIIGVFLLAYGAMLIYTNRRTQFVLPVAYLAEIGDIIWVLGSWGVLAFDAFNLSTNGRWSVLIVSDIILMFAVMQFIYLRRIHRTKNN